MMQLWRWIRGRSGLMVGTLAFAALSGCRGGGSHATRVYDSGSSLQPAPAVAPYDGLPVLPPPNARNGVNVDLGQPDEFPAPVPPTTIEEGVKVTTALPTQPAVPLPVDPKPQPSPAASRDVFADDPLPAAPVASKVTEPESLPAESASKPVVSTTKPDPVATPTARPMDEPAVSKSDDVNVSKPLVTEAIPAKPVEPALPEVKLPDVTVPAVTVPESVTNKSSDTPSKPTAKPISVDKSAEQPAEKSQPLIDEEPELPIPKVERPIESSSKKPELRQPAKTALKAPDDFVIPEFTPDKVALPKVTLPAEPETPSKPKADSKSVELESGVPTIKSLDSKSIESVPSSNETVVPVPNVTKPDSEDPLGKFDPFESEPVLPTVPLPKPQADLASTPMKPTAEPSIADNKADDLPSITASPVTKSVRKTEPQRLSVEKVTSNDVSARPAIDIKTPSGLTPGAINDPTSSLPLRAPLRIADLAEFDQPADHLLVLDEGSVLVSHRAGISKLQMDGRVQAFSRTGSPRGIVSLGDGFATCDASQRAIVKLNSAGSVGEKLATKSEGYFLRAPKDLVRDTHGGFYFTDPGYARIKNPIGQIHYVSMSGKVNVVAQKLAYPDGIALSPDQSRLYVVESQEEQLLSFEILSEGKVGPKKVLAKLPKSNVNGDGSATGIAVDQRGRIYVAQPDQSRIQVIDPDGRILTNYHCGNLLLTDIAVVPGDRHQLLVSGNSGSENGRGKVLLIDLAGR